MSKFAQPSKQTRYRWIVLADGCWQWPGTDEATYGAFTMYAHRWTYEEMVGPIPDGLQIDHLCRNKGCVNPEHLEPVTHAENQRRKALARTHCPKGHEWTPENTYINGGGRHCRTCSRKQKAERWERVRRPDAPRRAKRKAA